jgi:hypothetical protein
MLIRREGFGGESRRASLARRLDVVADIRRGAFARRPAPNERYEAARFVAIDQHQHGQDAA